MARTTITLDPDVRAKLETKMRQSGKSFKETVNDTLRLGLLRGTSKASIKPFKVRAKNLGLKRGYSFEKPWALIEELEGPHHR